MTQTKLNFLLAKPFKQNKNNNNTDGTPLLRKRKQHKKGERGKICLIKIHPKSAFLIKGTRRKVRVRGLQKMAKEVEYKGDDGFKTSTHWH